MVIRPEAWMETVMGSPARIRLLRTLAKDPGRFWTEREAATEARLAQSTANAAFRQLAASGLLHIQKAGRSHLVRLQNDYEVTQHLVDFFRLEAQTLDRALARAAASLPKRVAAYVFGSTARGRTHAQSDVDVLVAARDLDAAEEAAHQVRAAIRAVLPARVEVLTIDRRTSRQPRLRQLLRTVAEGGRRLTATTMAEALA